MSVKTNQAPPFMAEPLEFESQEEMKRFNKAYAEASDLYAAKDHAAALQAFKLMDEAWPWTACILGYIGLIYEALGRWDEAIDYLKRTVDLSPDSEFASTTFFLALQGAQYHFQDESYGQRSLDEAGRFLMRAGKPSVEYGYILRDMNGELSDEDHQAHMENIRNGTAQLEKPFVPRRAPKERWEWDKKFEE